MPLLMQPEPQNDQTKGEVSNKYLDTKANFVICEEILALSNFEKESKRLLVPESAAVVEGKNGERKGRPGSTEKAQTIPQ